MVIDVMRVSIAERGEHVEVVNIEKICERKSIVVEHLRDHLGFHNFCLMQGKGCCSGFGNTETTSLWLRG